MQRRPVDKIYNTTRGTFSGLLAPMEITDTIFNGSDSGGSGKINYPELPAGTHRI